MKKVAGNTFKTKTWAIVDKDGNVLDSFKYHLTAKEFKRIMEDIRREELFIKKLSLDKD